MIRYIPSRLVALPLLLLSLLTGCAGQQGSSGRAQDASPAPIAGNSAAPPSLYLQKVDGLHVTGTPVAVDSAVFRLKVSGRVERELSLSLDEVRALAPVREEFALECPGFFVDRGVWTGVPVIDLLELAGLRPQAARVVFTSLSEGYTSALSLEDCRQPGVLVAYEFDGRLFPAVHGYPLRLTAKGHPGSVWVKWLGEIQVLE